MLATTLHIVLSRWESPIPLNPIKHHISKTTFKTLHLINYSHLTSAMRINEKPFWVSKALVAMSPEEWESLCDGCGRCCLRKLEDVDTGLYFYTDVACRLLNSESCRCSNYPDRRTLVEDCVTISTKNREQFNWLPKTCAYRRLAEGKKLEWWHPLVSGNQDTVHEAGISVRGRTTSEEIVSADELEDHIISWIDF